MIRPTRGASATVPTSSMADIAFLLLVFFLVTTVFPKDKGLALVLPADSGDVSARNLLFLFVHPDGSVELRQGESVQSRLIRTDEVSGVWRDAVARNPDLIAAVKTSPSAPYGLMVDVLDELQEAGAQRISLQILER